MISIKINNIKKFMNCILVLDTFDSFLIKEGEVHTSYSFSFDGRINTAFFTDEELLSVSEDFPFWKELRPVFYNIIKGKKIPTEMKIIFTMPKTSYDKILNDAGVNISPNDLGGLYLHFSFENNQINIITGISLNVFTMDKTLDHYWDKLMTDFLGKNFDIELN